VNERNRSCMFISNLMSSRGGKRHCFHEHFWLRREPA
jgi:hypothetical protein